MRFLTKEGHTQDFLSFRIYHSFEGTTQSPLTSVSYTHSDAADDLLCVDLGGRRIIKKKKYKHNTQRTHIGDTYESQYRWG